MCAAIFVATSLLTPPPAVEKLKGLCIDVGALRQRAALLRAATGGARRQAERVPGCPRLSLWGVALLCAAMCLGLSVLFRAAVWDAKYGGGRE